MGKKRFAVCAVISGITFLCQLSGSLTILNLGGIRGAISSLCLLLSAASLTLLAAGKSWAFLRCTLASLGLSAILIHTPSFELGYPYPINVPLMFRNSYSNGNSYGFGLNLLPAGLFWALYFWGVSASKGDSDAADKGREAP